MYYWLAEKQQQLKHTDEKQTNGIQEKIGFPQKVIKHSLAAQESKCWRQDSCSLHFILYMLQPLMGFTSYSNKDPCTHFPLRGQLLCWFSVGTSPTCLPAAWQTSRNEGYTCSCLCSCWPFCLLLVWKRPSYISHSGQNLLCSGANCSSKLSMTTVICCRFSCPFFLPLNSVVVFLLLVQVNRSSLHLHKTSSPVFSLLLMSKRTVWWPAYVE